MKEGFVVLGFHSSVRHMYPMKSNDVAVASGVLLQVTDTKRSVGMVRSYNPGEISRACRIFTSQTMLVNPVYPIMRGLKTYRTPTRPTKALLLGAALPAVFPAFSFAVFFVAELRCGPGRCWHVPVFQWARR
jgi:hypothetical protein